MAVTVAVIMIMVVVIVANYGHQGKLEEKVDNCSAKHDLVVEHDGIPKTGCRVI